MPLCSRNHQKGTRRACCPVIASLRAARQNSSAAARVLVEDGANVLAEDDVSLFDTPIDFDQK